MSLHEQRISFLGIKPRVWNEGAKLCARTAGLWRLLSLFSYCRTMTADPARREITIEGTYLWFLRTRRVIDFDQVKYIDYVFSRLITDWDQWHGAKDQLEKFTVALVLHDKHERVDLFGFRGEGAASTGMSGILFGGDSAIDYAGDQDERSREFAYELHKMLGVPLGGPELQFRLDRSELFACSQCRQPSPGRLKVCQYCGGQVVGRSELPKE